jgi:hypothetical protein
MRLPKNVEKNLLKSAAYHAEFKYEEKTINFSFESVKNKIGNKSQACHA